MARPQRYGFDYFPFDVDFFSDEKIEFISALFGLAGEAILIRLLSKVYRNGYYINWDADTQLLFSSKLKGIENPNEFVGRVIAESVKRKFFDRRLFEEFGILTSRGIQSRFSRACKQTGRLNSQILVSYDLTDISPRETDVSSTETPINLPLSTHRIVNKTKLKESKREETTLSLFSTFFINENDITRSVLDRANLLIEKYSLKEVEQVFEQVSKLGSEQRNIAYIEGFFNRKSKPQKPSHNSNQETQIQYRNLTPTYEEFHK